jgi:membrane associated rhomboid family serine protease
MTPTSVGMRCPECARERTKVKTVRTPSSAAGSVTLILIAINVVLFLGETATGTPLGGVSASGVGTLYEKGALFGPFIVDLHQYYRLVTSGFLHDGILHILFNMWFLYVMGRILEPVVGRVNFVVIYLVSLLAGSFGALLFEPQSPTVGASGACFGILGALIVIAHFRRISIWQSGLGLTLVINVVFSLSVAGISIGGHIGGLIGGGICGLLIVQLGERRRMQAAAIAGCLVVGVISVIAAIAVAGGQGLTPNGLTL